MDNDPYFLSAEYDQNFGHPVLIQLNQYPEVKQVLLGELEIGGEARMFPADQPYTPRPTGMPSSERAFQTTRCWPAGRYASTSRQTRRPARS